MVKIKHKASTARKVEAAGYFLRSVAIVAPVVTAAASLTPHVKAATEAAKRKMNARKITKFAQR